MGHFFNTFRPHTVCLYSILATFSISSMPQIQAIQVDQNQVGLNDIAFALKIEKLVGKLNKYQDQRESNKLLDIMFELKMEIEGYTGKKINLDTHLNQVENDIKKKGGKLKKDEFKKIRSFIKGKEKRSNHKAMYMADCIVNGLEYDSELENLIYIAKHGNDNDADNQKTPLPLRVTIGVTVALCGLFLTFTQIPICQAYGPGLIQAGVLLAVEGTVNRVEEQEKKDKDKNK